MIHQINLLLVLRKERERQRTREKERKIFKRYTLSWILSGTIGNVLSNKILINNPITFIRYKYFPFQR